MRTLSAGNKTNFAIFIVIIFVILVIIAGAVLMGVKNKSETYQISPNSCVYDSEYRYIELENDAKIEKKWNGDYYLEEDITKKQYKLGDYGISYETMRNTLDLFGNFYLIQRGGDVTKYTDHNTISNTTENKFFKIGDRKYLIVADEIKNSTGSLHTQNYLIVILDKLGNELLLNNQVNMKTIKEMILTTNEFEFDVANEILRFDNESINLKKVIGSTNEYVPQEREENTQVAETDANETEENTENAEPGAAATTTMATTTTTTTNNNSTTVIQNNNDSSNNNNNNNNNSSSSKTKQDNTWVNTLNNWIGDVASGFESIYNGASNKKDTSTLSKSITLNSLSAATTSIDIKYTVTDPENKYNVVYAIVSSDTESYTISLDKSANTYKVKNLQPDTKYTVQIGYKIIYADATTEDVAQDTMVIKTNGITESLKITRVSVDRIYYQLKLDSDFVYDAGCRLVVYLNDQIRYTTIPLTDNILERAASSGYTSSFTIPSEYKNKGTSIKIQLEDTKINNSEVNTNLNAKIVNY